MRIQSVILSLGLLSFGACSSDDSGGNPDGGRDQRVDTAQPDAVSGDSAAAEDGAPDQKVAQDQGSTECDLGVPAWTGGVSQGQSDALFVFESADKKTVVKIVRTYVEWGVGESAIFALGGFSLTSDERTECVKDESALDYSNSHHNWLDQAVAKSGSTTYLLDLTYDTNDTKWRYVIEAVEDEKPVWGPVELSRTSGPKWN